MSEWFKVDRSALATPQGIEGAKVKVSTFFSPYDIPVAIGLDEDPENRRILVQFSYLDDEEWESQLMESGGVLRIGKNSGRIYGIELPSDDLGADKSSAKAGFKLATDCLKGSIGPQEAKPSFLFGIKKAGKKPLVGTNFDLAVRALEGIETLI